MKSMKRISIFKKPVCVLVAFCVLFTFVQFSEVSVSAQDNLSPEQEKAVLEQKIKEAANKLDDLGVQKADTQEYLDALNEKIKYLEQEKELVSDEVDKDQTTVNDLQDQCEKNETEIKNAEQEVAGLTAELDEATEDFSENYDQYCRRMRAMYISGETNVLTFLITSNDISQLLTRYEMIRRVSKQDGELLETIHSQIESINKSKAEITEKKQLMAQQRTQLLQKKEALEKSITDLNVKQTELDSKKTNLSSERANANMLLKKISDETGYYTEFLEDNKEVLEDIDRELALKDSQYADPTTTTTTTTTTKKPSAQDQDNSEKTTSTTTTATEKQENTAKYISLTYPVPTQKKITCPFHGYTGHSGADFSCPTGSTVVAAESGVVITSADLKNPDGSYRSYGRYIVIRHDKTTSSGDRVYTLYAHNSSRLVSEGDYVKKGQAIAKSGSTGNSTGPHCHFEVRTPTSGYSDCKNPEKYLP